jgi:hypothetical protein
MPNLAHTARLLDYQCQYEYSLFYFGLGWKVCLCYVLLCSSPLSAGNRVSDPKISVSSPSYL